MKYLLIERGQAFYHFDENEAAKKPIDQITKEDILELIELCLEDECFEMDEPTLANLQHAAHQIIYKNIYAKLNDVRLKRINFEDEMSTLYKSAIDKYSLELEKSRDTEE